MVDGVEKGPDIEVDHPASRCTISTVRCRALSSNVGIPIRLVVLVPSLGICTRRTGLARALAHLLHPYHIYLVFQCGENSYRIFARQCRKPSLSPWDDFLVRCLRHLSLYKLSTAIGDFPPVGSSGVSSPFLLGLISRLQLLMCHPTALRCLRLSIPCVVTSLRPPARSSSEDRSKIFSATPAPFFFAMNTSALPRFGTRTRRVVMKGFSRCLSSPCSPPFPRLCLVQRKATFCV